MHGLAGGVDRSEVAYAATQSGVFVTEDGGASWSALKDTPAVSVAVSPHDPDVLYAAGHLGVERSTDGGATWSHLPLEPGSDVLGYVAPSPHDPDVLLAATFGAAVYKRTDGGASWRAIRTP